MPNYNYVIDSSFKPFTFQEMLAPFAIYKEAAEKAREHYIDLSNKAGKFKVLSEYLPENSRARQLYEGYANELSAQAADFGRNGLTMMNQNALTDLRSRYQEEIGTLETAQTKLDELTKARDALAAAGKPMLYSNATPTIDDFLPGSKFNNYAISTDDLYARGAQSGKAASSRIYNVNGEAKTMGDMYYDFVVSTGWTVEKDQNFRRMMLSNKEMLQAAEATMNEKKVRSNLSEADQFAAMQSFINGFIDGAIHTETHTPQRNLNKLTAAEYESNERSKEQNQRAIDQLNLSAAGSGMRKVGNTWVYDKDIDPQYQRKKAELEQRAAMLQQQGGKGKGGTMRTPILTNPVLVTWGGNPDKEGNAPSAKIIPNTISPYEEVKGGKPTPYKDLPAYMKEIVDAHGITRDMDQYYTYYIVPYEEGTVFDQDAELLIMPEKMAIDDLLNQNPSLLTPGGSTGDSATTPGLSLLPEE